MPEWDNMDLYFGPMTVADIEAIEERDPKSGHERNLILLVHKAKNADGKPLFQMGDVHHLKTEADWIVLQRVFAFMFETALSPEEAREKIDSDPTSGGE